MNPNCYECKHRRDIPGNCHSACHHPVLMARDGSVKMIALLAFWQTHEFAPFNLTAKEHGIKNGWFIWPINFDPVWLNSCEGFEKKEGEEVMKGPSEE